MEQQRLQKSKYIEGVIRFFYFALYLTIAIFLVHNQSFGDPPDEYNRYRIAHYIGVNGKLPNGYDESIRIYGYGFSYAFQPILPYMIQGGVLRIVGHFIENQTVWVIAARYVNVIFGLIMAGFVLGIGRKLFVRKEFQYLFAFLVTFLPEALFLHTYVNTESCCMLSTAIIVYALLAGKEDGFKTKTNVLLAVGVILCILSYYNAYGYVVSAVVLFLAFQLKEDSDKIYLEGKITWRKFGFVALLVFLGAGWWFIRSAILYDGDFLGMKSRDLSSIMYGTPECNPLTRETWQRQGKSFLDLLTYDEFINTNIDSFICWYGGLTIKASDKMYLFYRTLLASGILLNVLPKKKKAKSKLNKIKNVFFHINMIFCLLMPVFLSTYYSYTSDYQAQGRYLLPSLIPFIYYVVKGFEKLERLGEWIFEKKNEKAVKVLQILSVAMVCVIILCMGFLMMRFLRYIVWPFYQARDYFIISYFELPFGKY